ncbi:methylenetetrahydrofolate reductase [NAD(P)H] [Desulfotalea psychrophila]|uniref:Methylenetetrahydrofolate reductase n=1 Tax=Desulfotalea psychrophila (strain LSv54 / DSM 12343) TaxID=177439 RepID=Q6AMT4_DESPS|nr:methylenetetrahydrofolate reductase [NAD(P)H] [Desulfotalea psychrophila]CAG36341.1 related to 5,10-methylenetetrahydrofolate reductase [Desulfotalea psychrophila LSv54]
MLVRDLLEHYSPTFSFEFFPPKNKEGEERLLQTLKQLIPLAPSYISITYGAGGSTREKTHDLVLRIRRETNLTVVSHLTCVGSSRAEILRILKRYDEAGIHNILALKGDPPAPTDDAAETVDDFLYAADLVGFIKRHFPHMCVGVAGFPEGHPETPNRLQEIEHLRQKVEQGADYIVTQLFYDNHDFYDFSERCLQAGITVPIVAGIMPVASKKGLIRTAELAAGARIPAKLLKIVQRAENDTMVRKVGIHWATEQVRDLIDQHVRGIQFFTLNTSTATREIYDSLGVSNSQQLQG